MLKRLLLTPGPTPVPPEVLSALAEPIVHHRAPRFIEILNECIAGMKYVFQTENDILIFAASGTGAMESAVVNLVNPGDNVIVASVGNFGERWIKLNKTWGADVRRSSTSGAPRPTRPTSRRRWPPIPTPRPSSAVLRDLHRRGQRHQGDRRDRRQDAGRARRRRHQRPGRLRPEDRRVEGRRVRRRLAEGAHDAARPGLRGGQREGLEGRRGSAPTRASTSTGSRRAPR